MGGRTILIPERTASISLITFRAGVIGMHLFRLNYVRIYSQNRSYQLNRHVEIGRVKWNNRFTALYSFAFKTVVCVALRAAFRVACIIQL